MFHFQLPGHPKILTEQFCYTQYIPNNSIKKPHMHAHAHAFINVSSSTIHECCCQFNGCIASHAGSLSYVWLARRSVVGVSIEHANAPCWNDKSTLSAETTHVCIYVRRVNLIQNNQVRSLNRLIELWYWHPTTQFLLVFIYSNTKRINERERDIKISCRLWIDSPGQNWGALIFNLLKRISNVD